jgi:hypothetical protein
MQVANISSLDKLKSDIYSVLINKKNLIFYDGLMDGLEPNLYFKFFYSSPHDALEFINLDIYKKTERVQFGNKLVEVFGVMSIITGKENILSEFTENIFGYFTIDDIKIRQIDKKNIKLFISKNGLSNIKNLINFYEMSL